MFARPEREPNSAQKLVARQPIVIPQRQLQTPLGQLRQRNVLIDERVVPHRRVGPLHDRRFLLRAAILIRQKVALAKRITRAVRLDRLQVLRLLDEHVQRAPALARRVGRGGRDRFGAKLAQVERSGGAASATAAIMVVV